MKLSLIIIALFIVLGGISWYVLRPAQAPSETVDSSSVQEPQGTLAPVADGTYRLVSERSEMRWQGSRPLIQGYFDNGTIVIASGQAVIADNALRSGSVVVDMTTIGATSTGRGSGETRLTEHLKSADWFDVEQYPESRFVITEARIQTDGTVLLSGSLTIQDQTHALSFPVTVTRQEELLVIEAREVSIDRTRWGIRYGSGSFFDNLGEQLIDDVFTLSFTAVFEHEDPLAEETVAPTS